MDRFCKILDGSKSGSLLHRASRIRDQEDHGQVVPAWATEESRGIDRNNSGVLNTYLFKGGFVMDHVKNYMRCERDNIIVLIENFYRGLSAASTRHDESLTAPYYKALADAEAQLRLNSQFKHTMDELDAIKEHVMLCISAHHKAVGRNFSRLAIGTRQDTLRSLSRRFHVTSFLRWLADGNAKNGVKNIMWLSHDQLPRIMASYLYHQCKTEARKPWDMAFRTLRSIKAESSRDGGVAITTYNYEKMAPHKAYSKKS
jgi:hypothetical protein